ncbi:hypothetical protein GCM10007391_34910 [Alteromonas halophila]|uniref:DUF2971 domain-containing protein n=2 Tax=Alteromonas halophila TaxID=516698 RepID=A0A918JRN1_9ALTE|nr:hypothetical protein GCM10007391_34910 [Alteromonas halophila]
MDEIIERDLNEIIEDELQKIPAAVRCLISPNQLQRATRVFYEEYWSTIKNNFKEMGGEASRVFMDKANELIGVLSLTEKRDNLLMWSHYASSHKGFCIGFDSNSPFFKRKRSESDEFYHLRKVTYRKLRPNRTASRLSGVELFLVKSLAWEYEQEWRMCAVLEDSEKFINSVPFPIHLFKYPNSAVKEVILGACIESEVKSHILDVLGEDYPHVIVKQAKISTEEFNLEYVDLN